MDIRLVFGQNMRRYRLAAGLSQEAVAERMGVDRAHVSSMERWTAECHAFDRAGGGAGPWAEIHGVFGRGCCGRGRSIRQRRKSAEA
jgi:Helix-turn-helix domain